MADARELAHEICEQEEMFLCKPDENGGEHTRLCDNIESALRAARDEALEEAALYCDTSGSPQWAAASAP